MFHKKYHTWFKRSEEGKKFVYFDYETSWSQKVSQNADFDESQFERDLFIDPRYYYQSTQQPYDSGSSIYSQSI